MASILIRLRYFYRASTIAVVLMFLAIGTGRSQEKPLPTIEEIQKAWQERQDRVGSARFIWKAQRSWPKGSISTSLSALGPELETRVPEAKGKVMPPTDKTVDFSYALTIDHDKVRFEYEGDEWANAIQDFRPVKYTSIFNGRTMKEMYPEGTGNANWPLAVIREGPNYRDAGLAHLRPLLLVYRPFALALRPFDIRAFKVTDQQAMIDGRRCVELVQELPRNSSVHIWVDTSRPFVLVRRLNIDQGEPFDQLDIRYRLEMSLGWVPTGWKYVRNNQKGGLFSSTSATVTGAEFNIRVEPNSFDFEFPPGARVTDETTSENYILRHDGTKRTIMSEDIGATYEQMLNSEPGKALQPKQFLKPRWRLATVVGIGLLAFGVLIWYRLRLRESPQAGNT